MKILIVKVLMFVEKNDNGSKNKCQMLRLIKKLFSKTLKVIQ